jgi:hypothetical protein
MQWKISAEAQNHVFAITDNGILMSGHGTRGSCDRTCSKQLLGHKSGRFSVRTRKKLLPGHENGVFGVKDE